MASARPLREVFADLVGAPSATGDPAALLRDQGHDGLPDDLVAEAVVSFADTAPIEVAEQLAPFVTAHSGVGDEPVPTSGWLDLLGSAPDLAGDVPAGIDHGGDVDPDPVLEFGTGAGPGSAIEPDDDVEGPEDDGFAEILTDPAELDDAADWAPTGPETDLMVDEFDDDDGEPGGEPLG